MVVNVCPAGVTRASPARVWEVLTTPERFGEWNDGQYVSSEPPGPMAAGQAIHLAAPGFGRRWRVTIQVLDADPQHHWIDLLVNLPLGIVNHERITLSATDSGGTLVRFN